MNLNGEWEFGAGVAETFETQILVPFCPQSQLSGLGIRDPGDVVWYRRHFAAPDAEQLLLHFGAVDYRATVWVNGFQVADHEGGHTPFTADISRVARGQHNTVVVRAEDPVGDQTIPRGKQYWKDPESIFYTPTTGIWQTVWLEPLRTVSIQSLRVTPDLDREAVDFEVTAAGRVEVVVSYDGEVVGRWQGTSGTGRIALDRIHTWSPEAPHLYDLEISLHDRAGREIDHVSSYFGMRKVEARDGCFWLNGTSFVQRLVLDQGHFPGGLLTAGTDAELRRDIELAKAMGFNGARKHQKVEDPRWLFWADKLGFLVWAEMANFHEHSTEAEQRLTAEWTEAVRRDRDHPAIVAWVPMNESFGLPSGVGDAQKTAFIRRLYHLTRGLDGTRPVMSNDGWEHATSDLCTLHDYASAAVLRSRYGSLDSALDPAARAHPPYLPGYAFRGEPIIVSEFGGVALAGSGGYGYSEVTSGGDLLATYRDMVEALMAPGPVEGFCYTQLTDVEQERNGLLTFDRKPKADPALIRRATQTPKEH